jgi:hypothetical protein
MSWIEKTSFFGFGKAAVVLGILALLLYASMAVYLVAAGSEMTHDSTLSLNDWLAMGLLCLAAALNLVGVVLVLAGFARRGVLVCFWWADWRSTWL